MSNNIKAKKQFGQNFLQDENIINKIIEIANVENQDILEIGPGRGALTKKIVTKSKSLVAYEIDNDLIPILKNQIISKNFRLINFDFLKSEFDWNKNNKKKIVANLPYYITSDILFKIFKNIEYFSEIIIMVQEEVADRLVAKVGVSAYGKLTVTANYFATCTKQLIVPNNAFFPVPKISSAIVKLQFNKVLDLNNDKFLEFVKKCFSFKRKTLNNNLKSFLNNEVINNIYKDLEFESNIRPQEISLENYKKMFIISER